MDLDIYRYLVVSYYVLSYLIMVCIIVLLYTIFSSELIHCYSDILFQSLFCPEKKNVEKLGLPSSFQLLSEIGEATSGILDRQVPQILVISHLFLNGLLKCVLQCTRIEVNCNWFSLFESTFAKAWWTLLDSFWSVRLPVCQLTKIQGGSISRKVY